MHFTGFDALYLRQLIFPGAIRIGQTWRNDNNGNYYTNVVFTRNVTKYYLKHVTETDIPLSKVPPSPFNPPSWRSRPLSPITLIWNIPIRAPLSAVIAAQPQLLLTALGGARMRREELCSRYETYLNVIWIFSIVQTHRHLVNQTGQCENTGLHHEAYL